MTVLPIAERELRVASRSGWTFWSRALAACLVALVALLIFDSYAKLGRFRVGGQQVFAGLAYLALAYSIFAGAALTADCVSSEKREETLGLLFLTDLKGYDVVVGKLVATSLRSIYGLLSTFPILSLPMLLGGVQASEFWRIILVLLNTLLLSLSMGLLVSTLYERQRVTTHLAAVLMLSLALIPVGFTALLQSIGGPAGLRVDPSAVSPIYSLVTAFETAYKTARWTGVSFWESLLLQFILALLLLARSCWLLPHVWQRDASTIRATAAPEMNVISQQSKAERRRMLDLNPFYWLAGRGAGMTVGMSVMIAFVAVWGILSSTDREDFAVVQGVGLLFVGLVTRLLIAVAAAQRLTEDKQSGALDLIITTPLTVASLLEGQWRALWKKLGRPFLGALALYAFLIFGSHDGMARDVEGTARWIAAACFFLLAIADAFTLGWLGMWAGLRFRQVPHGAAINLCKVVLPPAVVCAAFVWIQGLTSADEYLKTNPSAVPTLWVLAGLTTDLVWIRWARRKLEHEFRGAATDRFQRTTVPGAPWWRMSFLRS